jgi:hypothetical protein
MHILDSNTIKKIENYIFDAWDLSLADNDTISYVCSMSQQSCFHVVSIIENLIYSTTN